MGRLYVKEMIGDSTIGYFQNGTVTKGNPSKLMSDSSVVLKYRDGHIYSEWMGSLLSNQIAYCDQYGNIYAGNGGGAILAKCENGVVYDFGGYGKREVARYEGDMYGAAAAVVALMLHLGDNSKSTDSNSSNAQTDSSGNSNNSPSESSGGCISAIVRVLLLILLAVPIFVWCFLPLVICIFLLLENGIDFANDADGFFLVAIPLLIAGICSICITYNSLKSRITKLQANLCRLINNGGFILFYIISLWRDILYNPFSISTMVEGLEPPGLYTVLGWVKVIIVFAAPILAFIYLHKCKNRNK